MLIDVADSEFLETAAGAGPPAPRPDFPWDSDHEFSLLRRLQQLIAELAPNAPVSGTPWRRCSMEYPMTRRDRLERWATVLEDTKLANLTPFRDVELLAPGEREGLRTANSPLS